MTCDASGRIGGWLGSMALRVTVVMPLHNAADRVEEGVRSVQAQSLLDWELVVVDDASTDDSVARVEALAADDARIRVLRLERNAGPRYLSR